MERFCDSCSHNDAVISCDTCTRWYHNECFKRPGVTSNPDVNQCYKCVQFGSKPVQIAEFLKCHDQEGKSKITPKIYSERIARIIKDSKAEDLPVLIIAVAGVARSGKSFLLNLMIDRNIHHIERGRAEWTTSKSHISGFNWAQSATAVTFGIWMWEKAIITQLNDGSKVAILYVDTQGTGDRVESTDPAIDTLIMYLSLELATIQIHNINQIWRVEDTRIYEVCKLYGELSSKGPLKPFNLLVLMHRNWQNDNEYGWRLNYYDKEVKNVSKNPEALATLQGIKASFQSVDFAMLPAPGSSVTASAENLSIKDIKPKFLKSLESFFDVLYNQKHSMQDCIRRCKKGEDVIKVVKELRERVEADDLPPIGTPAEHLADSLNSQAYAAALAQFEEEVSKINADDGVEDYIKKIEKIIGTATDTFERMAVRQPQFLRAYKLYKKKLDDDLLTKQGAMVKTVELVFLQKKNEELKYQNLLTKEYQEALLSWERDLKSMNDEDKENLDIYKMKLQELSIQILQKFKEDVGKLGCDDKSLSDQLSRALEEKEESALKMAENEHTIQRIQIDLARRKLEQEKKDKEIKELHRRQQEGEKLSQEQQEQLKNYDKYTKEQDKINQELKALLEQQMEQKENERVQKEKELGNALSKVEDLEAEISKLNRKVAETDGKLKEQAQVFQNASTARGTTEGTWLGKGLRAVAGFIDDKCSIS